MLMRIPFWKLKPMHLTMPTLRSIAYMFDNKQQEKTKIDRITQWRTELSCYRFDIVYRPGTENIPPDTLSRAFNAAIPSAESFSDLHDSHCHPGVTRMYHFLKTRNLPYSFEDV